MALSALVTVADGVNSGQALTATSNTAVVGPRTTITVTLTTTTGVNRWRCYNNLVYLTPAMQNAAVQYECGANGPFSFTLPAPDYPCSMQFYSEVTEGDNPVTFSFSVRVDTALTGWGLNKKARGVVVGNIANLAAFTVAATDLTFAQGDRALLVAQSTAAQNGIYVVGAVTSGSAALTRAPDMPTGDTVYKGQRVYVSEGTTFTNTEWVATATSAVIGTSDPVFYPARLKGTSAAMAGNPASINVSANLWLLSTTASVVLVNRNTSGGALGNLRCAVADRGAGVGGTGFAVLKSDSTNETSTLDWQVINIA